MICISFFRFFFLSFRVFARANVFRSFVPRKFVEPRGRCMTYTSFLRNKLGMSCVGPVVPEYFELRRHESNNRRLNFFNLFHSCERVGNGFQDMI